MSLMMPRLRDLAALPLVAALSLTAACDIALSGAREEATETVTRSFPLSPGGTLDIATTNGRIEVVAGSGPTVEVKAVKVAKAATKEGAAELLKKLQIKEEVTADLVKLRAERDGGQGPSLHGWGTSAEVRYYVTVPANTKVVLNTTNGEIEVANVTASAQLETVNGQINARGLGGDVKASTINGGVDIALASADRRRERRDHERRRHGAPAGGRQGAPARSYHQRRPERGRPAGRGSGALAAAPRGQAQWRRPPRRGRDDQRRDHVHPRRS